MKSILSTALLGALIGCILAAMIGADFNAGLAPAGDKLQHAIEGAVLWGLLGLAFGGLLGAALGWLLGHRRRLHPVRVRTRRRSA